MKRSPLRAAAITVALLACCLPAAPALGADPAVITIALPPLSDGEAKETVDAVAQRMQLERGYAAIGDSEAASFPTQIRHPLALVRRGVPPEEALYLRLGYTVSGYQPPLLWASGEGPGGAANGDLPLVEGMVREGLARQAAANTDLAVASLEKQVIKLSYIDAEGALAALKSMGITTVASPQAASSSSLPFGGGSFTPLFGGGGAPQKPAAASEPAQLTSMPKKLNNSDLPVVVALPGPSEQQAGLVGADLSPSSGGYSNFSNYSNYGGGSQGAFGLTSMNSAAAKLAPDTVASPTSQLMVLYNGRYPEQLALVRKNLSDFIDRPARQVYVECMVLELSKEGLEELGVEWQMQNGIEDVRLGALRAGLAGASTLEFSRDSAGDRIKARYLVKLRALVRDGKAEVLSRPSVVTLDNRQATIRIGTDIPIATSKDASSYGGDTGRVSFSFQYLQTGILLNLRPRIGADGNDVSMLIDTVVSAKVPNQDLQVLGSEGEVLAYAPTISTRRVQTYARMMNNTPLIIGGLVNRETNTVKDKIPFLGSIPVLGRLFSASSNESTKREVIIVLTPHVLSETQSIASIMPKDEDFFDSMGNKLFRDSYRLRAEDVFDTRYIRTNRRLLTLRSRAEEVVRSKPSTKGALFQLATGHIPGEEILVIGMVNGTLQRLGKGEEIDAGRMIFFDKGEGEGENALTSLAAVLAANSGGADPGSALGRLKGQALALTFTNARTMADKGSILQEPTPVVRLVPCKDRSEWEKLMWEMNGTPKEGREEYTILLLDESDLLRLSRAIAVKRFISVNDGEDNATIRSYLVGKTVQLPEIKPEQNHLLEARVARYFFFGDFHYKAFAAALERGLDIVEKSLAAQKN